MDISCGYGGLGGQCPPGFGTLGAGIGDFGTLGGLGGFGTLGGGFGGGMGTLGGLGGFGGTLGGVGPTGFGRPEWLSPDFALDTLGFGTYDPLDQMRRDMRRRRAAGEYVGADVDWIPAVDIADTPDNKIIINVALPGVKKEDIIVEMRPWQQGPHDHLIVEGKRDDPFVERWRRAEVPSGRFRRTFRVHKGLKDNEITPKFENGQLTLTYPRVQAQAAIGGAEGKRIKV